VKLGNLSIRLADPFKLNFSISLIPSFNGADPQEVLERRDGLIDHIALQVKDIYQAFDTLRSSGFSPIEEAPVELSILEGGIRYFTVRGPTKEKIQLIQLL